MVNFYAFVIRFLFFAGLLKKENRYTIAVVNSRLYGFKSGKVLLMGIGIFFKRKVILIESSRIEEYEKEIEALIKSRPNEKMLIAAYSCGIDSNVCNAIARCFEMMSILEKSPLHQYLWVASYATAKSRV